jgi:hypothetical protein
MSNLTVTGVCGPADEPLVQMIVVTINGTRYALVGPVVHVPGLFERAIDISEIEFGEIMPAYAAAQMLQGDFKTFLGSNVQ